MFVSADFHAGNDTASVSGLIGRAQLYAASVSTASSCTLPRFTSEADRKLRFPTFEKAALSAAE